VEDALRSLASREEPLVRLLDRRPGEREARWLHLLAPPPTDPDSRVERGPDVPAIQDARRAEIDDRVRSLEAQVAHLYQLLGESPPTV
jgi:uncharacterized protein YceH (UPF0502 family)